MVYNVIGTMSGSSIDGLDIVYCTLQEIGGKWSYQINVSDCIEFPEVWQQKLKHFQRIINKQNLRLLATFYNQTTTLAYL